MKRLIPMRRSWEIALGRIILLIGVVLSSSAARGQRGRIEQGEITSTALQSNLLGDTATRPFRVYVPPSYDSYATKRYPVIYVLHGHTQNETTLITQSQFVASAMQPTLDSLIAQRTIGEMIAVFVNGSNRLGGSFYLSSPVLGDYETYITKELVDLTDSRYRTLSSRESRGILGFSMGGWGAMHLALKYPQIFSVVVAESGFYDSRSAWADGLTRQLVARSPTNLAQFASVPFPVNGMQGLFGGLLPNADRPFLFADYPYDVVNQQLVLNETREERCLSGDVQNGDVPRYAAQTVRLKGIKLVHGTSDTIIPISQTSGFTNALAAEQIAFEYQTHPGNHVFRADLALPFLSVHLDGGELYIAQPRVSVVSGNGLAHVSFATQAGVVYEVQTSQVLGNANWKAVSITPGTGQAAVIPIPLESTIEFVRVRASNM